MRKYGTHHAPREHQPEPPDNTKKAVLAQVRVWAGESGVAIHPETAWEIASWWSTPGRGTGQAFTAFEATGRIASFKALLDAIEVERLAIANRPGVSKAEKDEDRLCLGALRWFVATVQRELPPTGRHNAPGGH